MLHFTNIGPMELLIAIALFFQGLASLANFNTHCGRELNYLV